ncbi:hypothetical protein LNV09_10180 [Paucibacter sp. B2R-40]|nr:hypothetical protein [Paucibacter sp. B2R-40]MCV2354530.1 hypothetical protein [Paucibacter sp. B2R-40]
MGASKSIDRVAQLKSRHLYGMATAWSELLAEESRQATQSRRGYTE